MPVRVEHAIGALWKPASWLALSVAILAVDYTFGPVIQFQMLFVLPVSLAAWLNGRWWALALGIALSLARLYSAAVLDPPPWTLSESIANAVIRIVVLGSFAFLVARVQHTLSLAREVELLRGLLPICNVCKRIRDPKDEWQPLEQYISARSAAEFTQSVCPSCATEYYAESFDRR